MSDKKLRVAVYARVSTDQESQTLSYEMQKSYYEQYVNANPNWELKHIYADKGISGKYLGRKRPQFNEMLLACGISVVYEKGSFHFDDIPNKPSEYDLIIVKDEKRFARNTDINIIIKLLRENKKVGVFFETLGINTLEENDVTLKILFAMSEEYSNNLSKNLKISYERAHLKNPMILGKSAPFGYKFGRNDKNERTLIPIDDSYIKIVNDIFNMYIKGNGFRVIAKYVNEQGFKTQEGKQIEKYTIERIIKNEKYMGYIQVIRHTPESINTYGHTLRKYMDYDLFKSDKIIPMISEDTFKKANDKLKSKPISKQSRGIKYTKSKYGNKLYCTQCHRLYNKTIDSKGNNVYVCSSKREKLGVADTCKSPYVSEVFLNNFLDELLKDNTFFKVEQLRIKDIIEYFTFYKYALISTFFQDRDLKVIEELKIKIAEFEKQQSDLMDMLQGKIPLEVIIKKINSIDEEKKVFQKQLDKEEFSFESFKSDLEIINKGIKQLESYQVGKLKTHEDLLNNIDIFITPNSPHSKIRQKRNDCTLNFRSAFADEYQELEYSILNEVQLKPNDILIKRIENNEPFTEKEKRELDEKLKGII